MSRREGLVRRGWRWRRNALRRPTDVVEAWLVLVSAVLLCLTPLLGWWAGQSADRALRQTVRAQHAQRALVPATVESGAKGVVVARTAEGARNDPRAGLSGHGDVLRWTAPNGSTHTAAVSSDLEVWQRGGVRLWVDRRGDLVPVPLDPVTADTRAVLTGTAAASTVAGLIVITRQVAMWRLMRRRMASWEREWARVGQNWGRAGAGG
ncbi:Rv1733c family protein [Actinacidiphila yeochonensis]|uniref:Rv1733c family protein n=1 Tax=Actinacidiphila yeochonensis TaxID=89050 RepID=UPI0005678DC4|nr:hypothetical protein [Actinacidiphila yeochonensis]